MEQSGYGREGFAAGYDRFRPRPPEALLNLLCTEAQSERPRLVVDLGTGTGLSARAWASRAERVVGVEANPAMAAQAEAQTAEPNVSYVIAYASDTGLEPGEADIVTCSQSFHWMEPKSTLAEATRLLRSGGVFAAYDYDWPPVVQWEVEAAFREMLDRIAEFRSGRGMAIGNWRKAQHLERMERSGRFRFVREVVLHGTEHGDAERLIGAAHSLGPMTVLLADGVGEDELGLEALKEVAHRVLGDRTWTWLMGYRVRLGIK
jgi:ubiquinone/menaquinone biosynthesis C-methylase UbiE